MYKHYIYALFSNNVYNPSNQVLPPGWIEFQSMPDNKDFYAITYINPQLKQAIIAFRGTVITIGNLYNDFLIWLEKCPQLYTDEAQPYVDKTLSALSQKYPGIAFDISFTGHSLGAIFAELSSATNRHPAVSFESPGSGSIMQNMINHVPPLLPSDSIEYANKNVITYHAAPNMINSINPHVGQLIRLYPELDFNTAGCTTNPVAFFSYTLQQHAMKGLLMQFDPTEQAPLVYSIPTYQPVALSESTGYWANYAANPYYWDNAIKAIYPTCGSSLPFQAYKDSYIQAWLNRNNTFNQAEFTINAPGSSQYPSLSIWGTGNIKNILILGKGNFKIIAYGVNAYKVEADPQTKCSVVQMALDTKHESSLFIGSMLIQGYAINANKIVSGILNLANDIQLPWDRVATTVPDTYNITIGGSNPTTSQYRHTKAFTSFPQLHFTNSPAGQFNIISISYRSYPSCMPIPTPNCITPPVSASASSMIYRLTSEPPTTPPITNVFLYKYNLIGELIDKTKLAECSPQQGFMSPYQIYEKDGKINAWYVIVNKTINLMQNEKTILSCDGSNLNADSDNFNVTYWCSNQVPLINPIMSSMRYSISGYTLVTKNPNPTQAPIGKSEIFILGPKGDQFLNLSLPLAQDPYQFYFPGSVLTNGDTLVMSCNLSPLQCYSIKIETSALQYWPKSNNSKKKNADKKHSMEELIIETHTMPKVVNSLAIEASGDSSSSFELAADESLVTNLIEEVSKSSATSLGRSRFGFFAEKSAPITDSTQIPLLVAPAHESETSSIFSNNALLAVGTAGVGLLMWGIWKAKNYFYGNNSTTDAQQAQKPQTVLRNAV